MQTGRLEKGDVQSVIEFLLRLIGHIHFIRLSVPGSAAENVSPSVVCTQCIFPKHAFVCSLFLHAHLLHVWIFFVHMCFDFCYFSFTVNFCIFSLAFSFLILYFFFFFFLS